MKSNVRALAVAVAMCTVLAGLAACGGGAPAKSSLAADWWLYDYDSAAEGQWEEAAVPDAGSLLEGGSAAKAELEGLPYGNVVNVSWGTWASSDQYLEQVCDGTIGHDIIKYCKYHPGAWELTCYGDKGYPIDDSYLKKPDAEIQSFEVSKIVVVDDFGSQALAEAVKEAVPRAHGIFWHADGDRYEYQGYASDGDVSCFASASPGTYSGVRYYQVSVEVGPASEYEGPMADAIAHEGELEDACTL